MRAVFAAIVLVVTQSAFAATSRADTTAQQWVDEGQALFKSGEYAAALERFENAMARQPEPGMDYLVGRCHQELGHSHEAISAFERFLAWPEAPPGTRRKVEGYLQQLRAQVEIGTLILDITPSGALVHIDGVNQKAAHLTPIKLGAGAHLIEVTAAGYDGSQRAVDITGAKELRLAIALVAQPEGTHSSTGPLFAPWSYLATGLSVALAGVGAVLLVWGELEHQRIVNTTGYAEKTVVDMTERQALKLNASGDEKKLSGAIVVGIGSVAILSSVSLIVIDLLRPTEEASLGPTADPDPEAERP